MQLSEWYARYKYAVRGRVVPWKTAIALGVAWGLYSWMAFPVFAPIAAIQSLGHGFGWFNLLFSVSLGTLLGAFLIRLGGVLLPYVAPLGGIFIVTYLLAMVGLIRPGQLVFVSSLLASTVVLLIWWRYVLDTRPVDCSACHGKGRISVQNHDGSEQQLTCDLCAGSGATTLQRLSIKLTPVFLIFVAIILLFGFNALNWRETPSGPTPGPAAVPGQPG